MSSTEATISSQSGLRAPPPETRPTEASTPSPRTASSESRSPKATPSSTARTSAPRSWRNWRPTKAPRSVRVGVRRALAGEVRREEQPLGARRPRLCLGVELRRTTHPARSARGATRASPRPTASPPSPARCRARRGRTRGRCPPGRARSRAARRARRRTCRGRRTRAPAGRSRRRAPRPADRLRRPRRDGLPPLPCASVRRLEHRRKPVARELERVERPRRSSDAARRRRAASPRRPPRRSPTPREAQPDVVLRQHHARDPGVRVGLVPSQPEELRRREARQGAVPRQLDEALGTDALLDLRALRRRPLVVPEDRGPDHAVSAASSTTRPCICPRARCLRPRGPRRPRRAPPTRRAHQSSGSCSAQPGRGVASGYPRVALASTAPSDDTAIALTPVVPTSSPTRVGSAAMELRELRPGLWRWTAFHPEWRQEVGSVAYAADERPRARSTRCSPRTTRSTRSSDGSGSR